MGCFRCNLCKALVLAGIRCPFCVRSGAISANNGVAGERNQSFRKGMRTTADAQSKRVVPQPY